MRYIKIDNNGRIIQNSSKPFEGCITVENDTELNFKIYDSGNWIDDIEGLKDNKKNEVKSKLTVKHVRNLYDSDYKKLEKDIDDCITKEEIEAIELEGD